MRPVLRLALIPAMIALVGPIALASYVTIHTPTSSSPVEVPCCDCPAGDVTIRISWDVTDHPDYVAAYGVVAKMGIRHHDGTAVSTRIYHSGGGSCSDWTETKHGDPDECGSYYVAAEIYARTASGEQGRLLESVREDDAVIVSGCEDPILHFGPEEFDFGTEEESMEIIVRNAGTGRLEYTFSESCCWITSISPPFGSSTGEWKSHRVYVDRSCMEPGRMESCDISISGNGGSDSIRVTAEWEHVVSVPSALTGPGEGTTGKPVTFSASGSSCSTGHAVEYQFDWGDGSDYSVWSPSSARSYTYPDSGTYDVRVRARCSVDHTRVSGWSSPRRISIGLEPYVAIHTPTSTSPVSVPCCDCPAGDVTIRISWDVTGHPNFVEAYGVIAKMGIRHHDGTAVSTRTYHSGGGSCSDWTETKHGDPEVGGSYYVEAAIYARTASGEQGALLVSTREDDAVIVENCVGPVLDYGPEVLDFGTKEDSMEINVRNAGTGTLDYSLSESCCWIINIDPASGSSTGAWNSHRVYVDRACLEHGEIGTYTIPISSNGGSGSVVTTIESEKALVSVPKAPSGPSQGTVGQSITFTASGSSCNAGHAVEYQFDWGDGTGYSSWSSSTTRSHAYSEAGEFDVSVRARCSIENDIVSDWSPPLAMEIEIHVVFAPTRPTGPSEYIPGEELAFSTGGASCSLHHGVEYQFDWGDGNHSSWSASVQQSHAYAGTGTYDVRARARCAESPGIISEWSQTHRVSDIGVPPDLELAYVHLPYNGGILGDVIDAPHRMTWGESTILNIDIENVGGPIPESDQGLGIPVDIQLIDHLYGSEMGWNGFDTYATISSEEHHAILYLETETIHLSPEDITSLNEGTFVSKPISFEIEKQFLTVSPLWTDTIWIELSYVDENLWNNHIERKLHVSPGFRAPINVLVFTLTTYVGGSVEPGSRAALAASGTSLGWSLTQIALDMGNGDIDSAGEKTVSLSLEIISVLDELAGNLPEAFLCGLAATLLSLPEAATDLGFCLGYLMAVGRTLLDKGAGWIQSFWDAIGVEHLAWCLAEGAIANVADAITLGILTSQSVWSYVEAGGISAVSALAEGLITASNVLEGIARGLVDVQWAIANGLLDLGEAVAQGLISGWEWAVTGLGSISPSAYAASSHSGIEVLAEDGQGRVSGIAGGIRREEIPGSHVDTDDGLVSIWIPESAGEFTIRISGGTSTRLGLQMTHAVDGTSKRSEFELQLAPQTEYSASSNQLAQDGMLGIDSDGDGLIDGWVGPETEYVILKGDVNDDGRVDLADVRWVYQAALGLLSLTSQEKLAADFNGDGSVNLDDATMIADFISGHDD